jgi:hypothetical protein
MKKPITLLILMSLAIFSPTVHADGLDQFQSETNSIWSPSENGKKDSSQDAQINTSMWAWGIGLAVAIGIIFGIVKSYNSSSSTTTN